MNIFYSILILLLYFELPSLCHVRGIKVEDVSKYVGNNKFVCDGNSSHDLGVINDNYCDCVDGTDEPGTNACPHGVFYCNNEGHNPKIIPSSFVDDLVCDCCDGSDEFEDLCQNSCLEQERENAYKLQELLRGAQSLKEKAIVLAEELLRKDALDLQTFRGQLTQKERELAVAASNHQSALEAAKYAVSKERELLSLNGDFEEPTEPTENTSDPIKSGDLANNGNDEEDSFISEDVEDAEDLASLDNFISDGDYWGKKKFVPQELDEHLNYSNETKFLLNVEKEKRACKNDLEVEINELKAKVADLQQLSSIDFGENNIFRVLARECFTGSDGEFSYELCMFKEVVQHPGVVSAGKNFSWEDRPSEDGEDGPLKVMRYSHGAPCSGDLHRSTDVKLFCGKEDRFLSIKERKRCFYEIDFETPYVCPKPSEASEELFIHSEL